MSHASVRICTVYDAIFTQVLQGKTVHRTVHIKGNISRTYNFHVPIHFTLRSQIVVRLCHQNLQTKFDVDEMIQHVVVGIDRWQGMLLLFLVADEV